MKQLYIRCGYPTSMVGHWRLPGLGYALCGLPPRSRSGWKLIDHPMWPGKTCQKCQAKRDELIGWPEITGRTSDRSRARRAQRIVQRRGSAEG